MGRKRRRESAPLLRRRGQPPPATTPRRPHGANLKLRLAAALVVVLVVLSAAALWQWRRGGDAAAAPGGLRGANLLLVTIDTLRADRVGAPGLTPTLDALASGGLRFTNAYAHVPVTLPSHASIMTGLAPPAHGVRDNGSYRLAPARTTLAESLGAAGYRTGAFIGAFVLDSRFGLGQGFDEYDDRFDGVARSFAANFVQRRADEVLRRTTDWIAGGGAAPPAAPWFAWAHLFDPHEPYDAPEQRVSDPYDNEVAFTDAALGRFFARLRRAGALDHTLTIVTADHGEALGEHGEMTHTLFAYDTTLRVPLIIAGPGIPIAVRNAPVAHVDLMPTILDLLGLDLPDGLQGRSLRATPDDVEAPAPPIYFEALTANLTRGWAPLTGLVADRWKLIDLPIPELYDLEADPGETENLFARQTARALELQAELMRLRLKTRGAVDSASIPVDADARARLRALGYTSGRASRADPDREFTVADDPKSLLALHLEWRRVLARLATVLDSPDGRDAALEILEAQIEQSPRFAPAYTSAATLLIDLVRPVEAVALLDRALAHGLRTDAVLERLSLALLNADEPARAVEILEALVAVDAPWADDVNRLGAAYSALGRSGDARAQFQRALKVGPTAEIWKNLGVIEVQAGDLDAAVRAFREATRADPAYVPAWRLLGAALRPADAAGAIAAWRHAVDLAPDDVDALLDLTALLSEANSPQAARPYLERYLANPHPDEDPARIERVRQRLAALETR